VIGADDINDLPGPWPARMKSVFLSGAGWVVMILLTWLPATAEADSILVSAAASLADTLKEIGNAYEAQSKNTVKFNFGPSSGLARQIDEGAPADIFFQPTSSKWIISIAKAGSNRTPEKTYCRISWS